MSVSERAGAVRPDIPVSFGPQYRCSGGQIGARMLLCSVVVFGQSRHQGQ